MKKLSRKDLKNINGSGYCPSCPPGPYGPGMPQSCDAYHQLPQCCKSKVFVHSDCTEGQPVN